jgi:hypothetical protein
MSEKDNFQGLVPLEQIHSGDEYTDAMSPWTNKQSVIFLFLRQPTVAVNATVPGGTVPEFSGVGSASELLILGPHVRLVQTIRDE